ncbi:GPO family capsid scaffolding protein [Comamonas testosteroni]|uniref:GPO family capsid scaffolding protein n=1 Tax=Comamonas testosteroni TaxID=285 RepID=UPI0028EA6486|nr:GPO family capsid scaffolding protein [Comamonas testosteroni]
MPTKSKFFRVATEGATTDGREITRTDIEQMAKSYDPAKYAARVWLEHYRGLVPGGSFDALGDVTAIEAREVENGKLALFAQIEPLPKLIEMNKAKQKLFSSVEIHPKLGDTGGAYLFGLGVTDSPASLGTEVLKFSQTAAASPFADRKADKTTLFAAAQEFKLELETEQPEASTGPLASALEKFNTLLAKAMGTEKPALAPAVQQHSTQAPDVMAALTATQQVVQAFSVQQANDSKALADLQKQFNQLQTEHKDLVTKLSTESADTARPSAIGGDGYEQAAF